MSTAQGWTLIIGFFAIITTFQALTLRLIRGETAKLGAELRAAMTTLGADIRAELAELRAELRVGLARVDERLTHLKGGR